MTPKGVVTHSLGTGGLEGQNGMCLFIPWSQNVFSFDVRMCFSNFDQFSLCVCGRGGAGAVHVYHGVLVELSPFSL